jgi:hypothetical protein
MSADASSRNLSQAQQTEFASYNIIYRYCRQDSDSNGADPRIRDVRQAEMISDLAKNRYLHWCVDINRFETRLFHIPIPSMTDTKIISNLKTAYKVASGFRRWFSLTACYGVKFVMGPAKLQRNWTRISLHGS